MEKASTMLSLAQDQKVDAVLVSSVPNIVYLTGFSGFIVGEREAYILLTKEKKYIFSNSLYKEAIEKEMKDFSFQQISAHHSFIELLEKLVTKHKIQTLGIETNDITAAEYVAIKKIATYKHVDIWKARIYKNKKEIAAIEKACKIGDDAFNHVLNNIKHGMTELDVALELEYFIKKQGADISFRTIVAFGAHASLPHYVSSGAKLKPNSWVLMDFGVKYNNYCSDMTRTIFFGKATKEQKKMYQTVFDAQQKAIEYIIRSCQSDPEFIEGEESYLKRHSGNPELAEGASRIKNGSWASLQAEHSVRGQDDKHPSGQEADRIAREHIMQQGYPTIPHTLGHGIGIEVHEYPRLSPHAERKLEKGMVFSVEPGIYLPGTGGVRIEDLMVIEQNKARLLTHAPREFVELQVL